MNRRGFLKTVAAASPMILSASVLGRGTVSANDTINIGMIGLGGRARGMRQTCNLMDGIRIVAASDCFQPRLDQYMESNPEGQECTPYLDFREMIEKENLDGVMVETTTHARAWVTCHAMAMGCDVYIEKPMSLTIAEGREMVNLARKYDRVTQVGTQQRSIPLNNWACALVRNGRIGKLRTVYAPDFLGPVPWPAYKGSEPFPEGSNEGWWDVWTNQAPLRPYHHDLHFGWQRWWDYENGGVSFGVSGWGTHSYDQIQRGLGTDWTGPVEIVMQERYEHRPLLKYEQGREPGPEETGQDYYWFRDGQTGLRARVTMRYADGVEVDLCLDADNGPGLGARFIGEDGYIEINRDRIWAEPYDIIERDDRPAKLDVDEIKPHLVNWVECIRSRQSCTADIEYALRSHTLCFLVNAVREYGQVGEVLRWNPEQERFIGNDRANALMIRERRKGYELPA